MKKERIIIHQKLRVLGSIDTAGFSGYLVKETGGGKRTFRLAVGQLGKYVLRGDGTIIKKVISKTFWQAHEAKSFGRYHRNDKEGTKSLSTLRFLDH